MKLVVLLTLLVTMLTIGPALAYDWVVSPINGHLYTLVDSATWSGAEAQAVALGGHLVTIRSQAENDWVYQLVRDNKDTCYRAWIGLYKLLDSSGPAGGWMWISDEPTDFTNWVYWMDPAGTTMDPTGWQNHCAYMFTKLSAGQDEVPTYWAPEDDVTGNSVYNTGIVEVIPVPEPTSLFALAGGLTGLAGLLWRRRR